MNLFFAPSRKLAKKRREHGGSRIYDARERLLLGSFDVALRGASLFLGLRPKGPAKALDAVERILCLRLDRLGDLLMTLPALQGLRLAAPNARIELGVGSWNEPIARRLPFVDEVRVVDTPWAAWGRKVPLGEARRALQSSAPDLAIDFQGDVRVTLLMAETKAPLRAGYGDTGGAYLLTHHGRWDEQQSWYSQNNDLVRRLYPKAALTTRPYNFLTDDDRTDGQSSLGSLRATGLPLVGIQPSAGRALKEWGPNRFVALIDRLQGKAIVVLTGSDGDRRLVESIASRTKSRPETRIGLPLIGFSALVEALDLFVSGDTGPMHLSHAVGTKTLALFGPSDPVRYGPADEHGLRRVVRNELYCSPCNMIRRPPQECSRRSTPECMATIELDDVWSALREELKAIPA